jgi:hypothetical protein
MMMNVRSDQSFHRRPTIERIDEQRRMLQPTLPTFHNRIRFHDLRLRQQSWQGSTEQKPICLNLTIDPSSKR